MEEIMRVISNNRVWIMSLMLMIEIPVAVWMVVRLFKDGIRELKDQSSKLKGV